MTAGSKVLGRYAYIQEDATMVELLRKAGAIMLGKTNTHEFAYGPYTPQTRNPWDRTRIAGGSPPMYRGGGSAAALAAGMCLGAIGCDTGGSMRIPAACCGVTGLKPTFGRVSCYGVIPRSPPMYRGGRSIMLGRWDEARRIARCCLMRVLVTIREILTVAPRCIVGGRGHLGRAVRR